eukprot:TRINITY_DN20021_c0_g1_i1.p2 TRINITY_DN20021_c0_g1~~TRINITY_DN20021_c0_g1_i1.p2  ORF type:complete len:252 (-),score=38.26 TRINITY_DN20021_c0_g1_i1:251-1006(-)
MAAVQLAQDPAGYASPTSEEELQGNGVPQKLSAVPASVRSDFVVKVYSIVSAQLFVTCLIVTPIAADPRWINTNPGLSIAVNATSFVILITMVCCCQNMLRKFPTNFIYVGIFTVVMGVMLGFICARYTAASIIEAVLITALIFFGLSAYACLTKTDFTNMGAYVVGAGLALGAFGLVSMFFRSPFMQQLYAGLGALVFSFYIIFDTQKIMGGRHATSFSIDDYCLAAVTLYLDIVNLFVSILELLGDRRS